MAKDLILVNGKHKEKKTGVKFPGKVPRDLDLNDLYERSTTAGNKQFKVTAKEVDESGVIIVYSSLTGV